MNPVRWEHLEENAYHITYRNQIQIMEAHTFLYLLRIWERERQLILQIVVITIRKRIEHENSSKLFDLYANDANSYDKQKLFFFIVHSLKIEVHIFECIFLRIRLIYLFINYYYCCCRCWCRFHFFFQILSILFIGHFVL